MTALPPYVDDLGHGLQSAQIPADGIGCTLMSFFVDADQEAMQALVDKFLNAPADGAVEYSVIGSSALVSFSYTERDVSQVQQAGYAPNYENAFWIPLLASANGSLPDRITFWMPYIFISGYGGMITGREVWGFRKALGRIAMPLDPADAALFSTTTDVIDPLNNQTAVRSEMIVRVRRDGQFGALKQAFTTVEALFGLFIQLWGRGASDLPVSRLRLVVDVVRLLASRKIPIVNLKQFRDAQDSARACYQGIIETMTTPTTVYAGGTMHGDYVLDLPHYASHRIAQDLGIKQVADIPIRVGFWTRMDFVAEAGIEVWRA